MDRFRRRTAELLEAHHPGDPTGRLVDVLLVLLILANVAAIILETVDSIGAQYSSFFLAFELFSVAVFTSIPAAMWWAVISLTTVGYGDVVPVTDGGKIFAGFIALIGIGMMALPAAILASGFYREVHHRSETYKRAMQMALKDGRLSEFEAGKLEQLREELGINPEEALNAKLQVRHDQQKAGTCPHCGKSLL